MHSLHVFVYHLFCSLRDIFHQSLPFKGEIFLITKSGIYSQRRNHNTTVDNTTVTLILSHVCSSVRLKIEQTLSLIEESLITACLC